MRSARFYENIEFKSKEEEKKFINESTNSFSLAKDLIKDEETMSVIVIKEDQLIAMSKVEHHYNAIENIHQCLYDKQIEYGDLFGDLGVVLEIVNDKEDKYIISFVPEELTKFQVDMMIRFYLELLKVKDYYIRHNTNVDMDQFATNLNFFKEEISHAIKQIVNTDISYMHKKHYLDFYKRYIKGESKKLVLD